MESKNSKTIKARTAKTNVEWNFVATSEKKKGNTWTEVKIMAGKKTMDKVCRRSVMQSSKLYIPYTIL